MRISDWSSDVCSSDLEAFVEFGEGLVAARPLAEEILRKEEKRKEAEQEAESKTHNAEMRETAFQAVDRWEYDGSPPFKAAQQFARSEEHTSELQSLMRISYAVFCLKKKKTDNIIT